MNMKSRIYENALKDINPIHRMNPNFKPSFLDYPKNIENMNHIYLETDIGVLDVLSEITNVGDFNRVNEKAIEVEIFGYKCKVMSLDDLILVKKNLDRAKDKALYQELLEIKNRENK